MARILVVDGEDGARDACCEGLRSDGHVVIAAGKAAEALEAVRQQVPDLVVIDVGPPCKDGLGIVGELFALGREMRIVLHTTHMLYKDDFRSWLADAYVLKSGDTTALRDAVRDVLARSRRGRAEARHEVTTAA